MLCRLLLFCQPALSSMVPARTGFVQSRSGRGKREKGGDNNKLRRQVRGAQLRSSAVRPLDCDHIRIDRACFLAPTWLAIADHLSGSRGKKPSSSEAQKLVRVLCRGTPTPAPSGEDSTPWRASQCRPGRAFGVLRVGLALCQVEDWSVAGIRQRFPAGTRCICLCLRCCFGGASKTGGKVGEREGQSEREEETERQRDRGEKCYVFHPRVESGLLLGHSSSLPCPACRDYETETHFRTREQDDILFSSLSGTCGFCSYLLIFPCHLFSFWPNRSQAWSSLPSKSTLPARMHLRTQLPTHAHSTQASLLGHALGVCSVLLLI